MNRLLSAVGALLMPQKHEAIDAYSFWDSEERYFQSIGVSQAGFKDELYAAVAESYGSLVLLPLENSRDVAVGRCIDAFSAPRQVFFFRISQTYYACESDGNEYPFCYDCYINRTSRNSIQDYYYKPEPLFRGEGNRYFGVELEVDGAGEDDDNAAEVMSIANGSGLENLYCKHDGSLDDGFEMVTHPMTLAYHQAEMPWAAILRKAVQMGYTSHQAGTCGLHVHINRNAFGETEARQDAVIARILYFFEKNWEELLKFSRRTQHQLNQWAARYGYKDQPKELLDHAKKSAHAGRYTSVNLTNKSTIEFRIFRGTLKYNTLIATLQLLDRICDVALFMSDEELKAMSWTTFVSGCTQPELVQYLKERRLYVNEPVESEAEV